MSASGDVRDTDDLDRRLREAFHGMPVAPSGPGAGRDLLAALRRRRAQRRLGVLATAAAVALAAGATAYALVPAGGGTTTATEPGHAAPAAPAHRARGGAADQGPTGSLGGSAGAPGAGLAVPASCVQVRVQGSPARCAGTYTPDSGSADSGSTVGAAGTSAGGEFGVQDTTAGNAAHSGSTGTETVPVGRTITVVLPRVAGLAWEPVGASGAAAPAAGSRAVLRRVPSGVGGAAGAPAAGTSAAVFVAAHRGEATLAARARPACGRATASCPATGASWSLRVEVEGP